MIDLKKKYTFQGNEVMDIYHYSESISKLKYLIVIKSKVNGASSWWIAEDDPDLKEAKPESEPVKTTLWYPMFKDTCGIHTSCHHGFANKKDAVRQVERMPFWSIKKYIGTFPMEITLPAEDE